MTVFLGALVDQPRLRTSFLITVIVFNTVVVNCTLPVSTLRTVGLSIALVALAISLTTFVTLLLRR